MSWLKSIQQWLRPGPKSQEKLMTILAGATERGILSPDIFRMIESVLRVSDMQVRDVMVPSSQMIVVEQSSPLEMILPLITESGHSRFPVMNGQEIQGILLAKDLLTCSAGGEKSFDMAKVIRPAFFVPQSKRLDILLREFRIQRNHIAMVVDEYGHVAGLVTIEDVLEEIVGKIEDEYDTDEDEDIRQRSENVWLIRGSTPIADFNAFFDETLPADEFDTISGLILKNFGHFPVKGEATRLGKFRFKILQSDTRRIHVLEARRLNRPKKNTDTKQDTDEEKARTLDPDHNQ